jgi:hypothetical protein
MVSAYLVFIETRNKKRINGFDFRRIALAKMHTN